MIYHRWAAQIGAFYQRLFALVHRMLDGHRSPPRPSMWKPYVDAMNYQNGGWMRAYDTPLVRYAGVAATQSPILGMLGTHLGEQVYAQQARNAQHNQMMQGMTNAAYGMMNQQ